MAKQQKLGALLYTERLGDKATEIVFENGCVLQSYNTLVAAKIGGQLYLADAHDYSSTTKRHVKGWCGLSAEERRKGLANGTIKHLKLPLK